jgi:hypothetical protein
VVITVSSSHFLGLFVDKGNPRCFIGNSLL